MTDEEKLAAEAAAAEEAAAKAAAEAAAATAASGGKQASEITFTPEQQAHIDDMIADRVKRAEADARKKATDEAIETARRAQMDETERLKIEKTDAEERATDAEERTNRTLVNAEAKFAALAAGAKPERVGRLLGLLDLAAIAVTDDMPDAQAITKAIADLKIELPELFTGTPGPGRSGAEMGGSGKPIWTRAQIGELAKDPKAYAEHEAEIDAALAEGRITE